MIRLNNAIKQEIDGVQILKDMVDNIHIIYIEPEKPVKERKLAIFLTGLGGKKEELVQYLKEIADRGYVALAFDNYQHGERASETPINIGSLVFSNMRRYGWVVLGQTVLDTERVIDWAIEKLDVASEIYMGGISMGGDISISVAGIDSRVVSIAPIIATPDWMRPGMHEIADTSKIMDPGKPDAYSQFFYDHLNPITHLDRYLNCPTMYLTLGEEDNHIPPENMERFKRELVKLSPEAADRIKIVYVTGPNANHVHILGRKNEWWDQMLDWWLSN